MRAYLGLGSNIGERSAHLRRAVASLPDVARVSSVFETEPVGGPEQDSYLNLVVELETERTSRDLLAVAQALEEDAQRVRTVRWGPRTLDVDVLWHEEGPTNAPDLVVPHPRMNDRRFVLEPLAELAPELVPSGWQTEAAGAVRKVGTLDEVAG